MFPLLLDLKDRLVLVVGGGAVGRRKAAELLAAGARVRLVCLEPRPKDERSTAVEWRTEKFTDAHLDQTALAFAAATPEVNSRVVEAALIRNIWVNSATQPGSGDFLLPAVVRRGAFIIAVSTTGAAPALARSVREQLEAQFDDAYRTWVELLAELRPQILAGSEPTPERQAAIDRLCEPRWLERLRTEPVDAVRHAMRADAGLDGV